ncbi:hypothetical protein JXJ21_21865 [candidate division KSB1 bacterium]|nr:hypothetical protein [candidate division KSB1 bacterium]
MSNYPNMMHRALVPDLGSCYGHAWQKMLDKFGELIVISIISIVLSLPTIGLSRHEELPWMVALYLVSFSLIYSVFFYSPIEYGVSFAFLRAARDEEVRIKDIFEVFNNYFQAVGASVLVSIIVIFGFICCIVPGIIFACKLVFVPYLIVDRKLDCIEAIQTSWNMTTGYTGTIFLMGLLAIPILLLGLLCCCVGVVVSGIWIELAFAYLYIAVTQTESAPVPENGDESTL